MYDYCIIGAGPTGLTLAFLFSKIGKKCIIIDENKNIGGCHRVTRINGLFTEHGPRIYSNSYINTRELLKKMNVNFEKLFKPYNFTISNIGNYTIKNFTTSELKSLIYHYLVLLVKPNHGKDTSMKKFMETNMFTEKTKDYIDRLCRLTDGASSDKYTLNKFFQLFNQQILYTIYQPSKPNDTGLFKYWNDKLKETNNIDFMLESQVLSLNGKTKENVECVTLKYMNKIYNVRAKKIVMCIPPKPLEKILSNSDIYKDSFGIFTEFKNWVNKSTYANYIPVIFHWKNSDEINKINLANVWGFPKTEWGIAFIVLSNYMNFEDDRSKLVISTCITKTDTVSSFTGKTANQSNEDELKSEVFRQLKISFPNLPEPTYSIINPNVKVENDKWIEQDTAFIETYENKPLSAYSKITSNLYQVGTQNGKSKYEFTSLESAITNAIVFANEVELETKKIIKKRNMIEINDVIRFFILILIVVVFLFLIKKN